MEPKQFCAKSQQLENPLSLLRLVHVARKLTPGEPSAEDILAVIGKLAAAETQMNAYSAMFQQKSRFRVDL